MPAQMKPLLAGPRQQRVTLYDVPPSAAQDSYGQTSDTSAQIGDKPFWASVRLLRVREKLVNQQIMPTATHIVEMGWLGSAIPKTATNPNGYILERMYLILADGRRLDILEADDVEMLHIMWRLTCEERKV